MEVLSVAEKWILSLCFSFCKKQKKKTNDDCNNYKVITKSVFAHSKIVLDNLVFKNCIKYGQMQIQVFTCGFCLVSTFVSNYAFFLLPVSIFLKFWDKKNIGLGIFIGIWWCHTFILCFFHHLQIYEVIFLYLLPEDD